MSENKKKAPSRLGKVERAPLKSGRRIGIYGPPGVGKTTLANDIADSIFTDFDSTPKMSIARYPYRDGPGGHIPESFEEVCQGVRDMINSTHDFRVYVVDQIGALEKLMIRYILKKHEGKKSELNPRGHKKLDSIESFGFQKGYMLVYETWRNFLSLLERLRLERGMDIVLISHARVGNHKSPDGDEWKRYTLDVTRNDRAPTDGLLTGWFDVLGFLCFEEFGEKLDERQRRMIGVSTGRRLMKLERNAQYDAKSRYALPPEIELPPIHPWAPFAKAMADYSDPAVLAELVLAEVSRLGDDKEMRRKVKAAIKKAGDDVGELGRYLNGLSRRQPKQEETQEAA